VALAKAVDPVVADGGVIGRKWKGEAELASTDLLCRVDDDFPGDRDAHHGVPVDEVDQYFFLWGGQLLKMRVGGFVGLIDAVESTRKGRFGDAVLFCNLAS